MRNGDTATAEVSAAVFGGNSGYDLEVACIEGPKVAGSETKVSNLGSASRKGGKVSVIHPLRDDSPN